MKLPDPSHDLERTILKTFVETHAEAQITPIVLTLPSAVIEGVNSYTKERSLEPATLTPLTIKAMAHQTAEFSKAGERVLNGPDSPGHSKILCCGYH